MIGVVLIGSIVQLETRGGFSHDRIYATISPGHERINLNFGASNR
jgi:hypothetical protein